MRTDSHVPGVAAGPLAPHGFRGAVPAGLMRYDDDADVERMLDGVRAL